MKNKFRHFPIFACCLGCAALILDSKTAIFAVREGIEMCLLTVVPALFPMMILTTILTSGMMGKRIAVLKPLCKMCGIAQGGESLLLTGLIGGYPVGAACVDNAYRDGSISRQDASRLLGFCSNAGPSFVFGIAGAMFQDPRISWWLWGIHIVSALLVGMLLPGRRNYQIQIKGHHTKSLSAAMKESIFVMASVCGWILWMRVICSFLQRWLLWLLPPVLQSTVLGALELVNGCHSLSFLAQEGSRFVLCSAILAFGGICVFLQTATVTRSVGMGMYFPGKVLQSVFATLIAFGIQYFVFEEIQRMHDPAWIAAFGSIMIVILLPYLHKWKKRVAFSGKLMYNG